MEREKFPLHADVRKDFETINKQLAFPDMIASLKRRELGKAIIMTEPYEEEEDETQMFTIESTEEGFTMHIGQEDDESSSQSQDYLAITPVGYILPLQKDNLQHLFIFSSGEILVTKPRNVKLKQAYKEICEPSIVPFNIGKEAGWENSEHAISYLRSGSFGSLKVVAVNDDPEDRELFNRYMRQSLEVAQKYKDDKQAMREYSIDAWLEFLTTPETELFKKRPQTEE